MAAPNPPTISVERCPTCNENVLKALNGKQTVLLDLGSSAKCFSVVIHDNVAQARPSLAYVLHAYVCKGAPTQKETSDG